MSKVPANKLPKGVDQVFLDDIAKMSPEELMDRIVTLQFMNNENEAFKESEAFLEAQDEYDLAKERYNLVAGPIKDLTIAIKNKTKLIVERLKELGVA